MRSLFKYTLIALTAVLFTFCSTGNTKNQTEVKLAEITKGDTTMFYNYVIGMDNQTSEDIVLAVNIDKDSLILNANVVTQNVVDTGVYKGMTETQIREGYNIALKIENCYRTPDSTYIVYGRAANKELLAIEFGKPDTLYLYGGYKDYNKDNEPVGGRMTYLLKRNTGND